MLLIALCYPCRLKISAQDAFTRTGFFNFSDDAWITIGNLVLDSSNKSTRLKKRVLTLGFDLIA